MGYSFIALLLWNAATTWWIWNSTDIGSIAAIAANSMLMCLPWWGYFTFKNKYNRKVGYASLISFWMLFEYIHLNWQLTWPWLTLGNVFALHPSWVQWYEFTGVSGGTLWVFITNILLYRFLHQLKEKKKTLRLHKGAVVIAISLPLVASSIIGLFISGKITNPKSNVLIVQPNIDPYQKFESVSIPQQIEKLIALSEKGLDGSTQLVLWPETALSAGVPQSETQETSVYQPVFNFVKRHPQLTLITGIEDLKLYGNSKETATARKTAQGIYFDAFNSAVAINSTDNLQFYNKSKLVPGVESLPTFLNFMAPIFEHFGGSTGGYGRDTAAVVFRVKNSPYIAAPIICYESIYGEYVSTYVKKGANLLTIVTNDGWWGNTPGHQQHLEYARLRAIETRRWVARSANTGISAIINEQGNFVATQPWDKATTLKYNIPSLSRITFYVQFGDYLYKIAAIFAILLLAWNLFQFMKKRSNPI